MDKSISGLRIVGWYYQIYAFSYRTFCKQNSGEPGQTLRSAASGSVLRGLPMSNLSRMELPILIELTSPFPFYGLLGQVFSIFVQILLNRTFSKQIVY